MAFFVSLPFNYQFGLFCLAVFFCSGLFYLITLISNILLTDEDLDIIDEEESCDDEQ